MIVFGFKPSVLLKFFCAQQLMFPAIEIWQWPSETKHETYDKIVWYCTALETSKKLGAKKGHWKVRTKSAKKRINAFPFVEFLLCWWYINL